MSGAGQKLYLNEEQKDVVFYVGVDKTHCARFPAHKLVLSLSSPVFSAMLTEKFKEGESGEVVVTDITASAFRSLLHFAYTGRLRSPTVHGCEDILFAADKYFMPNLAKLCFNRLENVDINIDNFWSFISITCMFYSEQLPPRIVSKTLNYLDENANSILISEEFTNLDYLMVFKIVTRSSLKNVSEVTLLDCVFRWSQMECCRSNLPINAESERNVVRDLKYEIRYLLIPRDTLLDDAMNHTFLTQNEKQIILESSFKTCGELPPPWNNDLLKEPRGKTDTVQFSLISEEAVDDDDMGTKTKLSLLLAVSNDCIFEKLEITVLRENKKLQINCEITDLEDNVFCNFGPSEMSYKNNVLTVGKMMCLKKFKAYRINFVCVTGHIVAGYISNGFCDSGTDRLYLFLGDFPNDERCDKINCSEFWKKVLSLDRPVDNFYECARNTIVRSITIKI